MCTVCTTVEQIMVLAIISVIIILEKVRRIESVHLSNDKLHLQNANKSNFV